MDKKVVKYFSMDGITLVKEPIKLDLLKNIAAANGSDLVKAVIDVMENIMAIGGEMHADEEKYLMELDSMQKNLWGINIYPDKERNNWIEFDSMINIRPTHNNRSRGVDNPEIQKKIIEIVNSLIKQ